MLKVKDQTSKSSNEIELDLLPTGEILVKRNITPEQNDAILKVLEQIGVNTSDVEEFFKSGNSIEYLLGDETLCG